MKKGFSRISPLFLLLLLFGLSSLGQNLNQTDANGLKQGKWKKLYNNGKVRYEGEFKDDKPMGTFHYYYETGDLQATNNHLGNGEVATHIYHKNGKIKAKGIFKQQMKDSLWQYFNDNELLVLEESYILDTLHGAQKTYYENKQLGEETHYDHGVKNGPWKKFFDNGKPWVDATYENGNLHGKFVMYNEDGKRKYQGNYHKGIRVGVWLIFNDNGSVKTQDVYENGVLKRQKYENGEFTEYYDNEIPKSIYNYKAGKKQGEFQEFYNKGEWVETEVPGKMGEPDQLMEQLEGTQVKEKGWYNNDQLNGKVTYYNEDGSVDRVEVWEDGAKVSTIDWEGQE